MSDTREPITPNPPRWQPNPDPASIHVPGLDTTASVTDQIEQIEQLITIKLQNIDENFSKIHDLLANKVLPAIKQYGLATEPVTEAAKFWNSFYEKAAQIRIPTMDDYSTVNDPESHREEDREEENVDQSDSMKHPSPEAYEASVMSNESSFMPGQALFSSTPATAPRHLTGRPQQSFDSDDPSWTASLESPLVRLDKELQDFDRDDGGYDEISASTGTESPVKQNLPVGSRPDKGKSREMQEPLLKSVLRQKLHSIADTSDTSPISPLRPRSKPKTPILKNLNPYLHSDKDPSKWNGLVDLSEHSLATPQRVRYGKSSSHKPTAEDNSDSDSSDGLPDGMSPPVLMSPARPPRSSAELGLLKLRRTPAKEAAGRISRHLVSDIQKQSGMSARKMYGYATESSMSSVPTPPSLSRYTRRGVDSSGSIAFDSSLESMMRRVGLHPPVAVSSAPSPPSPPAVAPLPVVPVPKPTFEPPLDNDANPDSDSDSMDDEEVHNTAHPSAAFLMASQGRLRGSADDSFGSSNRSIDSFSDEDEDADAGLGLAPVHPFARVGGDGLDDDDLDDDSFDDVAGGAEVQEETLFGVLPVQRERALDARYAGGRGQLRMLGEDLLQDTIGMGARMGGVEESPTPAPWGGAPSR